MRCQTPAATLAHLDERVGNLVVDLGRGGVGAVGPVEAEGDGLVRVAAVLLQRLGRLGHQDRAVVLLLVHVDDVLQKENELFDSATST